MLRDSHIAGQVYSGAQDRAADQLTDIAKRLRARGLRLMLKPGQFIVVRPLRLSSLVKLERTFTDLPSLEEFAK